MGKASEGGFEPGVVHVIEDGNLSTAVEGASAASVVEPASVCHSADTKSSASQCAIVVCHEEAAVAKEAMSHPDLPLPPSSSPPAAMETSVLSCENAAETVVPLPDLISEQIVAIISKTFQVEEASGPIVSMSHAPSHKKTERNV